MKMHKQQIAVFLDRDGVINKKRDDYVKSISEFVFLPNVEKAIKKLNDKNYLVIIITNQSAVNRGIITRSTLENIHGHMIHELSKKSCTITKIYYCPHRPDENCDCRKPHLGMIKKAVREFAIDISNSWLIGDSDSDIHAAMMMGLRWIKIDNYTDLDAAVRKILHHKI